jgi:hypothetical protein
MRPMARADDLIPFQGTFGERCTIVGADVLDGVIVPLEIKYRDLHVIDTDDPPFSGFEVVSASHIDPVGHKAPQYRLL